MNTLKHLVDETRVTHGIPSLNRHHMISLNSESQKWIFPKNDFLQS